MNRGAAVGEKTGASTSAPAETPAMKWLLAGGALICTLGLLMGRWSPARLLDFQAWETVPWYFDLRLPLVVCGLLIVAAIKDGRPPSAPMPRQVTLPVFFAVLVLLTLTL